MFRVRFIPCWLWLRLWLRLLWGINAFFMCEIEICGNLIYLWG